MLHRVASMCVAVVVGGGLALFVHGDLEKHDLKTDNATQQVQLERHEVAQEKLGSCLDAAQKTHRTVCPSSATIIKQTGAQGPKGPQGEKGEAGTGIISTAIVDGDLFVYYSDGTKTNAGHVRGKTGQDGEQGPQGQQGKAGRGIMATTITQNQLVVSYTDGTAKNLGRVLGPQGVKGVNGEAGVGIAGMVIDADFHLIVTYTNSQTADIGQLPPGRGIQSSTVNADGNLMVTFTDGTTANAGHVVGQQGETGPQGDKGDKGDKGDTGVGITNSTIDSDGNLVLTYSDNTQVIVGKVVGRGIQSIDVVTQQDSTCHLIATYTDNTTHDAGQVPCPTGQSPVPTDVPT